MAFVGMQMLDNLYHHKPASLETDWSKDSFAPIPSFVDTGFCPLEQEQRGFFPVRQNRARPVREVIEENRLSTSQNVSG